MHQMNFVKLKVNVMTNEEFHSEHPGQNHFQCLWKNTLLKKNIFCPISVDKIGGKRTFEMAHCPFELSSN